MGVSGAVHSGIHNPENQVTIAGKGGIDAVVECMRRHATAPRCAKGRVGPYRLASSNPENKVTIAGKGGIDAVVEV